jgi:hypothetical protein
MTTPPRDAAALADEFDMAAANAAREGDARQMFDACAAFGLWVLNHRTEIAAPAHGEKTG